MAVLGNCVISDGIRHLHAANELSLGTYFIITNC